MTENGDLVPFVFPESNRPVRFVVKDGLAWPVLVDVCRELGVKNASNVAARLPEGCLHSMEVTDDLGRPRDTTVVHPHRGLPRVIMGSRSRAKERLESWIFDEVLPQIFTTGAYTQAPKSYLEALEAAATIERQRIALAAKVAELTPKADTYDAIVADESWYSASEVAKSHFGHLGLGRNGLEGAINGRYIFRDPCDGTRHPRHLCDKGHWSPYQEYVTAGLFCVKWRTGTGRAARYEFPGLFFSIKGIDAVRRHLTEVAA